MTNRPAYLRIADDLRRQIVDSTLLPGSRLPSRAQLATQYSVSDRVAFEAIRLLVTEGFVETRSGSGSYVRHQPEISLLTRNWHPAGRNGSPFPQVDMAIQGRRASWKALSESEIPSSAIVKRLGLRPHEHAQRTNYRFFADGEPVMLSSSWEPLTLTDGTPVLLPERGLYPARSVAERMKSIGVEITHLVENVGARPATAFEAQQLQAQVGQCMILVERTHFAEDRPVETSDTVIPSDRYQMSYQVPIGRD